MFRIKNLTPTPGSEGSGQSSISQREMRTLTGLVIVFFVFFGAFIIVPYLARSPRDDVVPATDESGDWTPRAEMGQKPVSISPELEAKIHESTEEERVLKEPEVYLPLLEQVNRRSYRFFGKTGFDKTDPAELIANPKAHRAALTELLGELLSVSQRSFDGEGALPNLVTEGVIKTKSTTPEGTPYYAAFALTGRPPSNVILGDIVRLQGVFFKSAHFDVNSSGSPSFQTGPFLIAKRLMKTYYVEEVTSLDPAILAQVDDATGEAKTLEFEPLYHTLSYVKHLSRTMAASDPESRSKPDPANQPPLVDAKVLREFPADYRGKPLRIIGRLEWLQKEPLDANPAGIDSQYRAILRSQDRILVEAVLLDKPVGVELGKAVEIEGIFFKNHAFPNQTQKRKSEYTWSPYIIGYSIKNPIFDDPMFAILQSIVLGVAIILAAVFSFVLIRDRQKTRQFVDAHREKRRLARQGTDLNLSARKAARRAAATKTQENV